MRYGKLYGTANASPKLIEDTVALVDINKMKKATVLTVAKKTEHHGRTNNVSFIHNNEIQERWLNVTKSINKDLGWDFDITTIEPIQYGEYAETQEYSWHIDQHKNPYSDNMVRKISFSVFLNDDYTGGEFDLEIYHPRADNSERFKTFNKLPLNTVLFFQSDYWHRVRPVTKGVRKSLVGWVLGPKFR